jgi:hypothetical protein
MDGHYPVAEKILIGAFVLMLCITTILSWHRLILNENFWYVMSEDDIPDRLDLSTY